MEGAEGACKIKVVEFVAVGRNNCFTVYSSVLVYAGVFFILYTTGPNWPKIRIRD